MQESRFTDTVLMVRPRHFGFNEETAMNNRFQKRGNKEGRKEIWKQAVVEFDRMTGQLERSGIRVEIFEDTDDPAKPDAVFPNNWVTFHSDGSIITYPMFSPKRRLERREDILKQLSKKFGFEQRYSLEFYENEDQFLEGTGSMVLDRTDKKVYAALGPRTDVQLLDKFCKLKGYEKIIFHAVDRNDEPIYHTNVMMALGDGFAVVCMESIRNEEERERIMRSLEQSSLKLIDIDYDQMEQFAGNMLQLRRADGTSLLVMSTSAFESLNVDQVDALEQYTALLHTPLETIETYGGGSARCMLAEIFQPA